MKKAIPIEKGNEYIAKIDSVSSEGNGVCRIDGYTVFVPQTTMGDKIRFRAVNLKSSFGSGELVEIIEPSPYRKTPVCDSYENCGGCQLMHIDYSHQLEIKRSIVENAMRRIGGAPDFCLEDIVGSKEVTRYRNKMIFHAANGKNGVEFGFYAQRSHKLAAADDCIAGSSVNKKILSAVRRYMNKNNITAYDEKTHKGLVKSVFTRISHTNGSIMAMICAENPQLPHTDKLVAELLSADENIKSIILNVSGGTSQLLGRTNITLYGSDTISDTLCGIGFKISPNSFFQINPKMTEKLYARAIEYADLNGSECVMDIYCGIGTISLCAAKKADKVIGIEIVEEAIEDAKANAEREGIENADFYAASAEDAVPALIEKGVCPEVVILDPPRKGSDEKTLRAIIRANPKKIVYVSCNPSTLARDAAFLSDFGYLPEKACAFDMFPNTTHVETVCSFVPTETKAG